MLREGSWVAFCNGTIYFRNATTQILRICQKFHFRSMEIKTTLEPEGNLAVFSGLIRLSVNAGQWPVNIAGGPVTF